jgi:hypothetical protein
VAITTDEVWTIEVARTAPDAIVSAVRLEPAADACISPGGVRRRPTSPELDRAATTPIADVAMTMTTPAPGPA